MTPRELFDLLHGLFLSEFEKHYGRPATSSDISRIVGKHKSEATDAANYSRWLRGIQTPRVDEMQRMCREWTAAGLRGIEVKVSIALEER